jgi:hypothetical protein
VNAGYSESTRGAAQPREREWDEPASSSEPSRRDERARERRDEDSEPATPLDEAGLVEIEPHERGDSDARGARIED